MFNLTGSEIVVILLLALVVLGPEKLPDAIRRFGRTYAELKRMSSGFQSEFRAAIEEPVREMRDTADMLGKSMSFGGDIDVSEPNVDVPFGDPAGADPDPAPGVTHEITSPDPVPGHDPVPDPEVDPGAASDAMPTALDDDERA